MIDEVEQKSAPTATIYACVLDVGVETMRRNRNKISGRSNAVCHDLTRTILVPLVEHVANHEFILQAHTLADLLLPAHAISD